MAKKKKTKTVYSASPGMFGLEKIMKGFYNYQPKSDDEYGNYQKNVFASNMIQSAFDTQNAKDLGKFQAEVSSSMMNQAANLQRLSTKDIMRKEYQYGTDMMKQQFQYQSKFSDGQYKRDLGTISAMGKEERRTNKRQQQSDERIADKQLEGTKYTSDNQLEGIKDTNDTSTENIRVTGDETRKTQDNEQRLRALNRSQEHKMARSTARAF